AEAVRIILDRDRLTSLHPSLKRHLLLRLGEAQRVSLEGVHIEAMLASLTRPGTALSLPGSLDWVVEYKRAWLGKGLPPSPLPQLSGEHTILVPGVSHLPGWKVTARVVSAPTATVNGPLTAFLDMDMAGTELLVRGWQDGDRFQPLGMAQEKKLQDFWVDARVPRPWRRHVPLLVSPKHILWVVGYRIDDRVKLSTHTRRVLSVEFTPTSL
ncbi:MAG: tRNA lysidine(34) synthetase TilS, partial [Chloroflexota bacterium]